MRLTDPDVDPTRERRRTSFDEKALQYDAIRPPYPEAVFDDLFHRTNARRVVEIGAGTGRATLPLARLGMDVVAIEPGPRLAAILRRKVAPFPSVTVEETTFEAWAGQGCPYDLVLAAQAIHWIDSAVRYAKPARIARHLVLLTNEIDRIDAQVREEFDRAYERWTGTGEGNERARHAVDHAIRKWTAEIDGSGLYGPVHVGAFPWETTYDAEEFVSLVDTWSDHATMEQPCRRGLYEALSQAIEHHGGRLRVPYVALAFVAESRADVRSQAPMFRGSPLSRNCGRQERERPPARSGSLGSPAHDPQRGWRAAEPVIMRAWLRTPPTTGWAGGGRDLSRPREPSRGANPTPRPG